MMRLEHGTRPFGGYQLHYTGVTDPGRVRPHNEDNLLMLPEAGVFAVADGLGGLDAGDVASATALAHLRTLCSSSHPDTDDEPIAQLKTHLQAVNRHTHLQRLALGTTMATTLAMVQLFSATVAAAAHVGDSRIYRWRGQCLTKITSDHSLVNELCAQGAMTEHQARFSPQRHVITRAIGAEPEVLPSIRPMSIAAGDLLLLCTDGLHGMVTDEALAVLFEAEASDSCRLAKQLVTMANEAGGHDNIAVIVLVFL